MLNNIVLLYKPPKSLTLYSGIIYYIKYEFTYAESWNRQTEMV